ncbi:caspase family protein [Pedobacter foliorum]|uniref:caspase family protein n=1 Tax=Pedobacter foliorum TaxID=2739058 RepID=UPI001563D5A2|nr:caspase family protein [Pedobacter foliorum]NRF37968.1 caspase family protein [Pedobacter foliorum]
MKKFRLMLFLLMAATSLNSLFAQTNANEELIFHSDFTTPDGWDKEPTDNFTVRTDSGFLLLNEENANKFFEKVLNFDMDISRDFSIEASISRIKGGDQGSTFGIIFGGLPSKPSVNNSFVFSSNGVVAFTSFDKSDIYTKVEDTTAAKAVKSEPGQYNKIKIVRVGSSVVCFINDVVVFKKTGIEMYGSNIGFDIGEGVTLGVDYLKINYLLSPPPSIAAAFAGSDKTPPQITITNPVVTRGLKVVQSGSKIAVTGTATDNSGIKGVQVNGINARIDGAGNFSADITLATGDNKLKVKATDGMMNTGEFDFIINRNPASKDPQPVPIVPVNVKTISSTGKYYALIIGIQDYNDESIPDLDQPIADAKSLHNILTTGYTFDEENVTLLTNPTRAELFSSLETLSHKITPEDNVLIFYAGHGLWDPARKQGYWFPSDAGRSIRSSWVTNADLKEYLTAIPSKHTLLITDACFAGSIFKSRAILTGAPKAIKELYDMQSRKAMTSGTLKEVPDKSVFIEYLVKRLMQNTAKYLSAERLYSSFREAVINNSANGQVPQYGEIKEAGDEGGDFIFIKK